MAYKSVISLKTFSFLPLFVPHPEVRIDSSWQSANGSNSVQHQARQAPFPSHCISLTLPVIYLTLVLLVEFDLNACVDIFFNKVPASDVLFLQSIGNSNVPGQVTV